MIKAPRKVSWKVGIILTFSISLLAAPLLWSADTDRAAWTLIVAGLNSHSCEQRVTAVRVLGLLIGNGLGGCQTRSQKRGCDRPGTNALDVFHPETKGDAL